MTNGEKYRTAQERAKAFRKLCTGHKCDLGQPCVMYKKTRGIKDICVFHWLNLEAEEEKTLPCPFCGGEVYIDLGKGYAVSCCKSCQYTSKRFETKEDAIAAHNRVAKKCREVNV